MADASAETATETTEATTVTATETVTDADDLRAEVEKWKALSKKNEERAKANTTAAKELETLRQSAMTEQDKAVAAAKVEGRTEALREAGQRLVEAEVRAAAAGRGVDIDALLEGVDRTYFLDDDGNPDRDAIQAWIDKLAPAEQDRGDGFKVPDLAQGTRSTAPALGSDALTQSLERMVGVRPR